MMFDKKLIVYLRGNFESHLSAYKVAKNISDLENTLKEHDGQLILLNKTLNQSRYVGGFLGSVSMDEESREAGLIVPPYLKINESHDYGIELIVRQKIGLTLGKRIWLKEGNIIIRNSDFEDREAYVLGEKVNISTKEFRMYVGDEEVKKFIFERSLRNPDELYRDINDLLKNPARVREIKDYEIKKAKEDVIESLEELLAQEKNLIEDIKKTCDRIKEKDDAKIAVWGKTEELDNIKRGIRINLDEAIKLKMHMDLTKYVVESIPGKKTEILISEYIMDLNAKYKKEVNA